MFPIPCNPLLDALLDAAALGAGRVKQRCWDLPTAHAMPQDTGLPDGSESRPHAGRLSPLSLPLKKRELMERKALLAKGSPGQPGSGSTMSASLCQPCLPRRQRAAALLMPRAAGFSSSWAQPAGPVGIRQPQARSTLPGRARDADSTAGTAQWAALGCGQPLGTTAACGRGWGTSDPKGSPPNYYGTGSCRHTVARTSLSRQARGLGTMVALPGHWSPGSPIALAGDEPTGGTELGGGFPPATSLPTACITQAQVYYGLPAPSLAAGTNKLGRERASLQDAGAAPATLPVPCSAARHPPRSPSEPLSPSPLPSVGAALLQPPPEAVSPHGKGEEKPPADRRDIPTMPTPLPTHLSASIMLSPTGPSYALVYSRPLCPAVAYWQRRAPSRAGELWSLLLPTASTAFALPHFQRGSLTALPGGRQKRVEELQEEDFLGCMASAELHLSPCLVQGIWRSPHPGFACLQVYLRDQDRQVRKVPSYREKGTPGDPGTPCPPCPNMQGTWWSPT